jgi:hypothetical protein
VLHHLVGLSEGQELADHDGSWEDFDEAADAVIDLVPTEEIIEEATRGLGPERRPTSRLRLAGQCSLPSSEDTDAKATSMPA